MLLLIAVSSCTAGEDTPEIAIAIEQPKTPFVLGQPIPLTVVFQNNLTRDVRIEGFDPATGFHIGGRTVCADGLSGEGSVTSRDVRATTEVGVERLSGKSPEADSKSWALPPRESQSFVLKAGESQSRSFDLMKTLDGLFAIDAPGRFKVSLAFRVHGEASPGYRHDPLEWEGAAIASPIEICVVGQDHPAKAKRVFCRGRGLRACSPALSPRNGCLRSGLYGSRVTCSPAAESQRTQ